MQRMNWRGLMSKLFAKLDALIGKSTLEHKLATYRDIVYSTCRDTIGVQKPKEKKPPK